MNCASSQYVRKQSRSGSEVRARRASSDQRSGSLPHGNALQRVMASTMVAVALVVSFAAAPATLAGSVPHLQLLPRPSSDIPCADSPFGRFMTVGGDVEMLEMSYFSTQRSNNTLHEWSLSGASNAIPPFQSTLTLPWSGYVGHYMTFLKAIGADLNGDGRDEIVVAMRDIEHGRDTLRLGVLHRSASGSQDMDMFSTWTLAMDYSAFDMVAGDLDGSQDGQQELALMLRSDNPDNVNVFFLTGNAQGGIDQPNNVWAGMWSWHPNSNAVGALGLAAGHLLLNGREQVVVAAESNQNSNGGGNRRLGFHLLEYQSPSPALTVTTGSWNVASKSFDRWIGEGFPDGSAVDWDIDDIERIDIHGGNVAGDAADELVMNIGFLTDHATTYSVVQFLQHFRTTRDASRAVTDVQLATAANGDPYDSVQLVSANEYLTGTWDVAVDNIDNEPHAEIVFAHDRYADGRLQVDIYKAATDLTASFAFYQTGNYVQFHDNSVGFPVPFDSDPPRWYFDDGTTSDKVNPNHRFPDTGNTSVTYQVKLSLRQTVTTSIGTDTSTDSYTVPITIDGGTHDGTGMDLSSSMYKVLVDPSFSAYYQPTDLLHFIHVRAAIGDMDRDGSAEIMTVAQMGNGNGSGNGLLHARWRIHYNESQQADGLVQTHTLAQAGSNLPIDDLSSISLIAADFDGDSVEAVISADCRQLQEPRILQQIWAPPYFQRLQPVENVSSWFGQSTSHGTSIESAFGAYTSTSITAYVGADLGVDIAGVFGASGSVRETANRYRQAAKGHSEGSDHSFAISEGVEQTGADALVSVNTNKLQCYEYDVRQAKVGIDPDSSLRVCEVIDPDTQSWTAAQSAWYWDREFPKIWAAASQGHAPPTWIPVVRDWASLSLFKPVTSGVYLLPGHHEDLLTDGRFDTYVQSQVENRPYIEIDLGAVREVTTIRVYAPPDSSDSGPQPAAALKGFHVFTSTTAMPTSGLPSGPGVHEFTPDRFDGVLRSPWNIWARIWNPVAPDSELGDPIRARYVRLQYPGTTPAELKVAEIQVFGKLHQDPPRYPVAVCDPASYDGVFLAKIWDRPASEFRAVQVHGDILWSGTGSSGWVQQGADLDACSNHAALQSSERSLEILDGKSVGGHGGVTWSYALSNGNSTGTTTSFETSTSVGTEFELTLSAGASYTAGGSKEETTGSTHDYQSKTFWTDGIDMGGSVQGFESPYNTNEYVTGCHYHTRPYAYRLSDQSNTGYSNTMYVVDYVVPDTGGTGLTAWQRGQVPWFCGSDVNSADIIFRAGFEGAAR